MKPLLDLIEKGGPTMIAIIVLSLVLYSRCFKLLLSLRRMGRVLIRASTGGAPTKQILNQRDGASRLQQEIRESFHQQRIALASMIAAAPLLGLLGTVSGMVTTFESLSLKAGEKSMEGLARGISEVLIATESGLLVALPALLFVYLGHREVLRLVALLNPIVPPRNNPAAVA
jgi:biopolymer transport protein ExbB